jgi:S-DNA-T family DNA segregation ATPase FtsK/SpoIIIE
VTVGNIGSDHRIDVTVASEPEAPVHEFLEAVRQASGVSGELWNERAPLSDDGTLVESGLRDGAVLGVDQVGDKVRDTVASGLELRVVGGPAAGLVYRLGAGRFVVGRQQGCAVLLADPELSREHAALQVSNNGSVTIVDLGSSNGTLLEGLPVESTPLPLSLGQVVNVGGSYLSVNAVLPVDGALSNDGQGGYVFNRRYRIRRTASSARIEFPTEPLEEEKAGFPWVMMVAPLVISGAMVALIPGHPLQYLAFAAMSPVMVVGSQMNDRRTRKRRHEKSQAAFTEQAQAANQQLNADLSEERARRRDDAPDPALLTLTAMGPRGRLWERRTSDVDYLSLRIGLAQLPSAIELVNNAEVPPAWAVPVILPLPEVGVLGVAAPIPLARSIARWLALQSAVLHSPDDVRIFVLTDGAAENDWDWLRWLPHTQLDPTSGVIAIGNDADTLTSRVKELQRLIRARTEQARASAATEPALPHVVVIIDGAKRLRSLPGMLAVLHDGPSNGVFSICLDVDRSLLPEECGAVVAANRSEGTVTVERHGQTPVADVVPDAVAPHLAETAARALAPIHRIGDEEGGGLPSSARFVDIAGLEPVTPDAVIAKWSVPGRHPRALLGAAEHGPLYLDLATDGPHGLVAGTTGAGKSELLQTMVAGLASGTPPDELNIVLVDYKGGAAFRDCRNLPHTVGMVTDLDGHLTERALRSLRAELKRREHILAMARVKDIGDYQELRDRGRRDLEPLPRLVIVIDEFASLVLELPEFIKGLVGIAQLGRALGVHLILATQRPSGVVSPEIRANANFAIALRVVNASESSDIIGRPDAAAISPATPGRAFLRISQEPPVAFQTARVGGRRPGAISQETRPVAFSTLWPSLGRPDPAVAAETAPAEAETDLHALVEAIAEASTTCGYPPQRQPWLEPLPEILPLDELPPAGAVEVGAVPAVPFGLYDLPGEQAQYPACFDPAAGRHFLVSGSPRSGRSTLLRTLAASVARSCTADDVHLYGLDCGNGALLALRDLPHVGAVVTRTEPDRVERLLARLTREVKHRQTTLIERGLTHATEQRNQPGDEGRWPYLVLLLDGWEGFLDAFHDHKDGVIEQQLLGLLRDGNSVGITIVMTGDRSLAATSRVASLFEDRFALRFNDRDDYTLLDLTPRKMPDHIPPGRAFRAVSGEELQVALLATDATGPAQGKALAELVGSARARHSQGPQAAPPLRVDALPTHITLSDAEALEPRTERTGLWVLVGVGGDEMSPWWIDLAELGPGFVITGQPESGRTTALVSLGVTLAAQGCQLVVVDPSPRPSLLATLNNRPGVAFLSGADGRSPSPEALPFALDPAKPLAVLVDDAEMVDADNPWLTELAGSSPGLVAIAIAGALEPIRDGFRGFPLYAKRAGLGLLLSPKSHLDATVFNATLPRGAGFTGPPGRGYLFQRGRAMALVQVPVCEPSS